MILKERFDPMQKGLPERQSGPQRYLDDFDRRSRFTLFAFLAAIALLIGAAVIFS